MILVRTNHPCLRMGRHRKRLPHGVESDGAVARRKGNGGMRPVVESGVVQAVARDSEDAAIVSGDRLAPVVVGAPKGRG
jgi:hypothetical protein